MFSIYGLDGRTFHSTLEELYRIKPKEIVRLSENQEASAEQAFPPHPRPESINQNALNAYRELIHAQAKDELHHVYEVMSNNFINLSADASAYSALMKIQESPFNELPVVNQNNSIIGLISYSSIIEGLAKADDDLGLLKISAAKQFLTGNIITTEPVTSIRRVAEVMCHYDLETVPVVDSYGMSVGIITSKSIVSAVSNEPPLSVWS